MKEELEKITKLLTLLIEIIGKDLSLDDKAYCNYKIREIKRPKEDVELGKD